MHDARQCMVVPRQHAHAELPRQHAHAELPRQQDRCYHYLACVSKIALHGSLVGVCYAIA